MSAEEADRIAKTAERARRGVKLPMKYVLPTVAALGAGAAVAVGSIPDSGGVIHGCYSTVEQYGSVGNQQSTVPYGSLRLIDPSNTTATNPDGGATLTDESSCLAYEAPISWNQQGPPGPVGPQGAQGPQGAAGDASVTGGSTFDIQAAKGTEIFLKLDGISGGTAKTKGFKGDFTASEFAFGAQQAIASSQSTGAGAGKVSFQTFKIVKKIDKASPALFQDVATGHVIKLAQIDIVKTAKVATDVATYKLYNVVIKGVTQKGNNEVVTGLFQKIQSSIGAGKNKISPSWNKVTNASGWNLVTNP